MRFALALVVASVACGALACLVDVDETLLDRASVDAASTDAQTDQGSNGDSDSGDGGSDAEPYRGMPCGTGFCTPPSEVCCATTFGDPDITHGKCTSSALCDTGDYFGCTSPRDCAAGGLGTTLCCVVRQKGAFTKTRCVSTCDDATGGLCDPNGTPCPSPQTCRPSVEFRDLFECGAPL